MRRWVLLPLTIITLLLAAVLLGMPLIVGMVVQDKYTAMLAQFSRTEPVEIKVISYQRHWFSSDVVIEVSLDPYELLKMPEYAVDHQFVPFILTQKIHHGLLLPATPQLINSYAPLDLKANFRQIANCIGLALIHSDLEPAIGKIDATSIITLNGALTSTFKAPALHYHSDTLGVAIDANDVAFTLFNTADLKVMKGMFHTEQLLFESPELIQQVERLDTHFDLVKGKDDLLFGTRKVAAGSVNWQLSVASRASIGLKNVEMSSISTLSNDKIDTQTKLLIEDLKVDDFHYGRQEVDLSVGAMDLPTFLLFRTDLSKIAASDTVSLSDIGKYMDATLPLLSKGMKIDLNKLYLSTPWGIAQINAKAYFSPTTGPSYSLEDILDGLSVDMHIELPSVFFVKLITVADPLAGFVGLPPLDVPQDKIREQIEAWVKGGSLIPMDKGFVIDLTYKNRQSYLNNNLFDPEKFSAQKVQKNPPKEMEAPLLPPSEMPDQSIKEQ
ncbi:MAG: hypothetical protein K0Q74_311 [Gammaproteobacteria bacterium]|jgi:uncharacterized protein YdgA (DUF945 family)|nr:hypothetical protein [Gammaproteobacteria bacterium]